MTQTFDTIFRGGIVVNQDGEGARDVGVSGGRIAALGDLSKASAGEVVDCKGLHILPGVIDTQVHFREPGGTHKEDLKSGSRSAVMGGVTAVFEMPNTDPLTITPEALADKVKRGHHRMHCDYAFFIGGTYDNYRDLPEWERLPGCCGHQGVHGIVDRLAAGRQRRGHAQHPETIRRRASFHAEDEQRLNERKFLRVEGDASSHPVWRDAEAALIATQRLVRVARETGARVHVLHISTAQEMEFLKEHKDVASVEVTPHHLTLEAPDCYQRLGTRAQMNPPVRDGAHKAGIWYGWKGHCRCARLRPRAAYARRERRNPIPATPSGMTGVQTLVPLMLDHVNAGRLSLARFVDLSSAGPARLFGIAARAASRSATTPI
jgi:dihydroorotase